jgi:hypothetical protein
LVFGTSWCNFGANAMETMDTVEIMDKILLCCETVWIQWTPINTMDTLGIKRRLEVRVLPGSSEKPITDVDRFLSGIWFDLRLVRFL